MTLSFQIQIVTTDPASFLLNEWMVVRISGPDAVSFLNGLTTRDLNTFQNEKAYLSSFLNPKGKITSLYWIVKTSGTYSLDGTSVLMFIVPEMKESTVTDLLKYNINVDIKLEDITLEIPPLHYVATHDAEGFPNMDPLFFLPAGNFLFQKKDGSEKSYFSLLEPPFDFIPFSVFKGLNPLESGLKGIVDLQKGCFLGQEPISRMTYRGRPRFQLARTRYPTEVFTLKENKAYLNEKAIGTVLFLDKKRGFFVWQVNSRDLEDHIYDEIINSSHTQLLGNY
ncbi:MAG: hypothetical protein D6732_20210 [Methanobacteriota archaeon]|nr:MAG: hypothetical protein D6732_20210 [Euryarchaeota archaeon]